MPDREPETPVNPGIQKLLEQHREEREFIDRLRRNPTKTLKVAGGALGIATAIGLLDLLVIKKINPEAASLIGIVIANIDMAIGYILLQVGGMPKLPSRRRPR